MQIGRVNRALDLVAESQTRFEQLDSATVVDFADLDQARMALEDARQGVDLLRDEVLAETQAIVGKPDDDITVADMGRLARLGDLPEAVRPPLVEEHHSFWTLYDQEWIPKHDAEARYEVAGVRARLEHQRALRDPSITLQSVVNELAAITSKPRGEVTLHDLERAAILAQYPEDLLPNFPELDPTLPAILRYEWSPQNDEGAAHSFAAVERWVKAQQVGLDPAVTPEMLKADLLKRVTNARPSQAAIMDVRTLALLPPSKQPAALTDSESHQLFRIADRILGKASHDLTRTDIRRLSMLYDMPHSEFPRVPESTYSPSELHDMDSPTTSPLVWDSLAYLRDWAKTERMLRDPAITRESIGSEVAGIVTKRRLSQSDFARIQELNELPLALQPAKTEELETAIFERIARIADKRNDDVTHSDVAAMALIEQLPDDIRPMIHPGRFNFEKLHEFGWLPGIAYGTPEMDAIREWVAVQRLLRDPDLTPETIRTAVEARMSKKQLTVDDVRFATSLRVMPESRRSAAPTDTTRRLMLELVASVTDKPDKDITVDDLAKLAFVDGLPKELRPAWQIKFAGPRQHFEEEATPDHSADAQATLDQLRDWVEVHQYGTDPTLTTEQIADDIDLLLKPGPLAPDDLRHAMAIGALPAERLPEARTEWAEAARAELYRIAGVEIRSVTLDDLSRLSLIEGLPASLVPHPPSGAYTWREAAREQWLPKHDKDTRTMLEQLATWVEYDKRLHDPAVTPETIRTEIEAQFAVQPWITNLKTIEFLAGMPAPKQAAPPTDAFLKMLDTTMNAIARKKPRQMSSEDLIRIAQIDALPPGHRPNLPGAPGIWKRKLGFSTWEPNTGEKQKLLEGFRAWRRANTPAGIRRLTARVEQGTLTDAQRNLLIDDPKLAKRVGAPREMLVHHAIRSLHNAGKQSSDVVDNMLIRIATLLEGSPSNDPAIAGIEQEIARIARTNAQRAENGEYIDYAELGDMQTKSRLIQFLQTGSGGEQAHAGKELVRW